jgi:ADP-heptose:LPS heptosyltransferase/SAM-dependent methyltransferase
MISMKWKLLVDYYVGGALHGLLKPPTVILGKLLHRDHSLELCSSVTFLKMLGGGSLVIAYPALLALKRAPGIRRLRLITTPGVCPFARTLGVFDEIIVIRDNSPLTILLDSLKTICKLFRCQVIVDLEIHSRLTTVFSLLTCARNRVGFYTAVSFWRKNLCTHLLFFHPSNPVYLFYDQIAALFGAMPPDTLACAGEFRAHLGLGECAPTAGRLSLSVAPCCSELSTERMLRIEDWLTVLDRRLAKSGGVDTEIHLLGGPGDRRYLDQLANLIMRKFPAAATKNHAGVPLSDSLSLLARSDELLCVDSALMHFGRLLNIPTTSFWGPTDPQTMLRPSPINRDVVHYQKLSCSPCVHVADRSPCRGDNVCMRLAVEPERLPGRNPVWLSDPPKSRSRCPICGLPRTAVVKKSLRKTGVAILRCLECQTEFLDPQPNPDHTKNRYSAHDDSSASMGTGENSAVAAIKTKAFVRRIQDLQRFVSGGKILDVGTATEFFLEAAQAAGFEPYGIELSDYAGGIVAAKSGVAHIHTGALETAPFCPGMFDAIAMTDLLEHVTNPLETLRIAHRLLKPDGALLLTTPNNRSLSRKLMGVTWTRDKLEHLFYLNPRSMDFIARAVGFRVAFSKPANRIMSIGYLQSQLVECRHWALTPLIRLTAFLGRPLASVPIPLRMGENVFVLVKQNPSI